MAYGISLSYAVPNYDRDDLVQECVLRGWEYMDKPANYIRVVMHNRLKWLARFHKRREKITLEEDVLLSDFAREAANTLEEWTIPVPKSQDKRKVVVAMVVNSGRLAEVADELGWGYWKTVHVWRRYKQDVRRKA